MNGTVSLILLFWATFFAPSESLNKTVLLLVSAACFVYGSYHVWSNEHARVAEFEARSPDFFYEGAGSQVIQHIVMNPPPGTKAIVQIDFLLRFMNRGAGTAYNLSSKIYACWINDKPCKAELADSTEPSVGRTRPDEAKSLGFSAQRYARGGSNLSIPLNADDVLVILVEIQFRLGNKLDSPICDNEPIWKMWEPRIPGRMCDANESVVRAAQEPINRFKAKLAVTPPSSTPDTEASPLSQA